MRACPRLCALVSPFCSVCLAGWLQWDVQAAIVRINASLLVRGYKVWFDLDMMKGSTLDAMSEAVEGAEVMLYGLSKKYKESVNCRMEAQYGNQRGKDMIPLRCEKGYTAKGWLGLILGSRLWYDFSGELDEGAQDQS